MSANLKDAIRAEILSELAERIELDAEDARESASIPQRGRNIVGAILREHFLNCRLLDVQVCQNSILLRFPSGEVYISKNGVSATFGDQAGMSGNF